MGQITKDEVIRFEGFELNPQTGELRKHGIRLNLQDQPFKLLVALLQHPGEMVSREELRQSIWPEESFGDFDHAINRSIAKLRSVLGDSPDVPHLIETLPRRGYRFIGTIDGHRQETSEPPPPITPLSSASVEAPPRFPWWKLGGAVALLVIAAGGAVHSLLEPEPRPQIVGSHVLTKTGTLKAFFDKPFIDRGSLYFWEQNPSGRALLSVPAAGGEVLPGPAVNGVLRDISRDGSQLLSQMYDAEQKQLDAWTQAVPSGGPRLAVRNVRGSIWASDAHSFFFSRSISNNDAELYHANADGTEVQKLATVDGFFNPHLSPEGARIRFTGTEPAHTLWEVGTDGRNLHLLLGGRKNVNGGSWSPDGKYYFFSSWDGDRWSLWAVREARHWWRERAAVPQQLTFGPMSVGNPAISNDGKQLYATGEERHGELSVYDPKAGKFIPYLSGISVCYVDFSRDGQWMAYVSYPEGTLWRSRIDGSNRRQLTVPPLAVVNPRWSPDGKLIAFTDWSNGDRHQMTNDSPKRIYVVSADGGGPELLLVGDFGDPTWSPDGNSIAYNYNPPSKTQAEAEVRILNLQTRRSTTVSGSQGMWSPRWSPDGKYLVALLRWPSTKLMLFSFASNTWEELASASIFGWLNWSRDSKFVYALNGFWGANDVSLVRIAVSDHKEQQIASLRGFRATAYYFDRWNFGWIGLDADDRPITTRNTGIEEIYAFDLEYK